MKFKRTSNQSIPVGETAHEKLYIFSHELLRQVALKDQPAGIEAAIQSPEGQAVMEAMNEKA